MRKRKIGAGKRAAATLALVLTIAGGIAPTVELAAAELETAGEFATATEDESTTTVTEGVQPEDEEGAVTDETAAETEATEETVAASEDESETTVTPAAQSADEEDTITDEMVAEIKARNECYRERLELIDDNNSNLHPHHHIDNIYFNVEDFDGDGYEELIVGDSDGSVSEIYDCWESDTGGWVVAPINTTVSILTMKGACYYCAETGYLLHISIADINDGGNQVLYFISLSKKTDEHDGGWWYIPLFNDENFLLDVGEYYDNFYELAWDAAKGEYYAAVQPDWLFVPVSEYAEEIQNTINTCVPISSTVLLETKYEYNETNLDLFLPVDEDLIRARLADPADESDAVSVNGSKSASTNVYAYNQEAADYYISGADGLLGSSDAFMAKKLEDSSVDAAAKTALSQTNTAYKNIAVYEFTLTRAGMEIHEFPDYLTITFPLPENMSAENSLQIYRLEEDGTLTACETTVSSNGLVSFTTNHLSTYILVEAAAEENAGNENQGGGSGLNNNSNNLDNSPNGNSSASDNADSVSEASPIAAPQTGDLPLAGTFAASAFSGMLGIALIGSIKLRNYRRGQNFKLHR